MSSPPKESSPPSLLHQLLHKQRDLTNEPLDPPREDSKAAPLPSKLPFDIPGEYADYMLPPVYKTLTRFKVYESSHKIYIIGGTPDCSEYRILKIDRFPTDPEVLPIEEDPAVYDQEELDSALEMLGYSLESTGGLTLLASGVAILGCIKFLYGYYLHMVTASHVVARIGAHAVHAIDDTTFIQLWNPQAFTDIATNVVTPAQLQEAGARHVLAQGAATGGSPLRPASSAAVHADAPDAVDASPAAPASTFPGSAGSYAAAARSRRSRSRSHSTSRGGPDARAASRSSSASGDDSLVPAATLVSAAPSLSVAVRQRPRQHDTDSDSSGDSSADECGATARGSPSSRSGASVHVSPGRPAAYEAYESIGAAASPRHSAAHPHRGAVGGMSPSLSRAGEDTEDDTGATAHAAHGQSAAATAATTYPVEGAAVPPVLGGAAHPRMRVMPLRNTCALPAHVSHFRPKKCRSQETKYRSLYLMLELAKGDHYFSYTYPLSHRLQNIVAHSLQLQRLHSTHQALARAQAEAAGEPFTPMPLSELYTPMPPLSHFAWNNHHLSPLAAQLPAPALAQWTVVLVHGYVEQAAVPVYTRTINLTLIARRAKQFAGTRYLKRGISQCGDAANEIEVEQLLHDAFAGHHREGQFASHVQVRASIPLFWTQEGNAMVAKPDITVTNPDLMSMGTRTHIASMLQRYGAPLILLNLIKQEERRPRETVVGGLFSDAMGMLNSFLPSTYALHYLPWDYKRVAKSADVSILDELAVIAQWSLHKTGLFHTHPRPEAIAAQYTACSEPLTPHRQSLQEYEQRLLGAFHHQHIGFVQRGVVRSNCIDSLDRTNVAQFCVGKLALAYQLYTLGVLGAPLISHNTGLLALLLEMYERMGDAVALQYGGSQMHRQMKKDGNKSHIMAPVLYRQTQHLTKPKEIYVSLIRHYQNSFQDKVKQDAINVFLGKFAPSVHLAAASSASSILDSIRGLRARAQLAPVDTTGSPPSGALPAPCSDTPPRLASPAPRAPTTVSVPAQPLFADAADVPIWEQESDYFQHNPPPDAAATYLGQVCFGNHRWWAFPLALFETLLPWNDFVADKVVHAMAKVFLPDYPAYDPLLAAGYRGTDAYALHCVCACHTDSLSPLQCLCDCPKHGAARRRRVSPASAALALLPHWAPQLEQWQAHALMFGAALDEACDAAAEAGLMLDEDAPHMGAGAAGPSPSSSPCAFERAQPTLAQPPSTADIAAAVAAAQPLASAAVEVYHVHTDLSRATVFTPAVAAQLASLVHPRRSSYASMRHAYRHGRRRCVAAAALPSPAHAQTSPLSGAKRPVRVPPLPLPLRLGVVPLAPLAKYSAAAPTLLDDVAGKGDAGSSLLVEDRDDSEAAPASDAYVDALAHTSSHEACMQALPLLPLLRACALMGTPSVAAALVQMVREERARADTQGPAHAEAEAEAEAEAAVVVEEKREAEEIKTQGKRSSKVKAAVQGKHAASKSVTVSTADRSTPVPAPAAVPSAASVSSTIAASPAAGSNAHSLDSPDAAPVCAHVVSLVRGAVAAITRSGVLSREAELAFDATHNTQYRHERVMWGAVDEDDDATAARARARAGAREAWSGAETVYSAKHVLLARGGRAMMEQGRAVTLAECAEGRADVKAGAYVAGSAGRNSLARADWCSSPGPRSGRAGLHVAPYQFRLQQPLWPAADAVPSSALAPPSRTAGPKSDAGDTRGNATPHTTTTSPEQPQASHAVYVAPPPPAPAGVVSAVLQALQTLPYVATTPLARLLKVCLPPSKELPAASQFVVDALALHVAENMIHSTDPYLPEPKTDHVLTALLANAFTPAAPPVYAPHTTSPLPLPTFASKLPTSSLQPPRPVIAQFSSIHPNTPVPLSMPLAPADLWSPLSVALRVERIPVDGAAVYAPDKPTLFAPTPGADESGTSAALTASRVSTASMEESKDQSRDHLRGPTSSTTTTPTSPSAPQPTAVLQPFPDAAALSPVLRRQLRAALQQYRVAATSASLHGEAVTEADDALSDEDVYASSARWERQRPYVPVSASTVLDNLGVARGDAEDDGELVFAADAPPRGPDVVEVSRADVPSARAPRAAAPLVSRKVAPNKTPSAASRAGRVEPVQYGVGRAVVVSGVDEVVGVCAVRGVVVGEDDEYAYVEVEVSDDEDDEDEEATDAASELPTPAALRVHTDTETMDLSAFETATPTVDTTSNASAAPQATKPSFCLPEPISAALPALPAPLRTLPDLAVHVPRGVRSYCDDWRFSEQQWGDIFAMSREDAPAPVELQTDTSTFDRYLRYL